MKPKSADPVTVAREDKTTKRQDNNSGGSEKTWDQEAAQLTRSLKIRFYSYLFAMFIQ